MKVTGITVRHSMKIAFYRRRRGSSQGASRHHACYLTLGLDRDDNHVNRVDLQMSIATLGRYLEAALRNRIAFDVADFHVGDVLQVNLVDVEHLRTRYRRPRPSPLKSPRPKSSTGQAKSISWEKGQASNRGNLRIHSIKMMVLFGHVKDNNSDKARVEERRRGNCCQEVETQSLIADSVSGLWQAVAVQHSFLTLWFMRITFVFMSFCRQPRTCVPLPSRAQPAVS